MYLYNNFLGVNISLSRQSPNLHALQDVVSQPKNSGKIYYRCSVD